MSVFNGPLAGYLHQQHEFDAAFKRVLAGGNYVLGNEVEAFEHEFSQALGGARPAVAVASGTDALVLALRAFNIGVGDQVITVSHTAGATVAAIMQCGAMPVLVDVDPITLTIDPQCVAATIRACQQGRFGNTRCLRAILVVHLYGQVADMPALSELAKNHGLVLIEDCAQAFGALSFGQAVGNVGDAAAFSFYPTKNLGAFGDGGAVYLANPRAQRLRSMRQYGWVNPQLSLEPGVNSRLDALQAAFLRVQLGAFETAMQGRLRVAMRYQAAFQGADLSLPNIGTTGNRHGLHLYVVRSAARDRIKAELATQGIPCQIHYPHPVHLQPGFSNAIQLGAGGLANTEQAARTVLSLPMHPYLPDEVLDQVAHAVLKAL